MGTPSFARLVLSTVATDAQTTHRNVHALARLRCPGNGPTAFDLVVVTESMAWTAAGSLSTPSPPCKHVDYLPSVELGCVGCAGASDRPDSGGVHAARQDGILRA